MESNKDTLKYSDYPKNAKELRERIKGKGLRTVSEGQVLNAGLKGLIKDLFKK